MQKWKLGWMAILALLLPALVFGQVGGGGSGGLTAPVALTSLDTQAAATVVGRASGAGTGVPTALTAAQTRAIIAPLPLTDVATQAESTILGRAVGAGTGVPVALTATQARAIASVVRQTSRSVWTTVVSTTTATPVDGTIPQRSETASYQSAPAFTPTQSDSRIRVRAFGQCANANNGHSVMICLFKGAETDALASQLIYSAIGLAAHSWFIDYEFSPGSTSAITFEIRFGAVTAGTAHLPHGSTYMGASGPIVSMIIEELAP